MDCGQLLDGRYRIREVLGRGGMGCVYLAEHVRLGTMWAVKEIHKSRYGNVGILEPEILKKLNHPSIPRIIDILEDEDLLYIVCDFIEGESLDKQLESNGRFPEKTVSAWALQLCDALSYLHTAFTKPIIYRDMKPQNILIDKHGKIKLIDFGIAREYKAESGTDTAYIGTRGYAAPEQYGAGQTSVVSDIYSLGVTLYHVLTGKSPNEPPFEIKPARSMAPDISEGMEGVIAKCTQQDPQKRYRSVAEVQADILNVCQKTHSDTGSAAGEYALSRPDPSLISGTFRKLVLSVWDNAEFGCELAYMAARLSGLRVLLVDLDLLNPRTDLLLNIRKTPARATSIVSIHASGINLVMDAAARNRFDHRSIMEAAVKRPELPNLHIITGSYKLSNYEYFSDENLMRFIDKAYQTYDVTVLLVNRSIYDSYTVVSMARSDFNISAVKADVPTMRELNSCISFLCETQQIDASKTKFVAFEYDREFHLSKSVMEEISGDNFAGCIRSSRRRKIYRNLKIPYARRMEKEVQEDYAALLSRFNILPKRTFKYRLKNLLTALQTGLSRRARIAFGRIGRRRGRHAGHSYTS